MFTLNIAPRSDLWSILEQFTEFYYKTFDEDRKNLAALYVGNLRIGRGFGLRLTLSLQRDNSMLTFESAAVGGAAGIVEKLVVR